MHSQNVIVLMKNVEARWETGGNRFDAEMEAWYELNSLINSLSVKG